jgi:hypothetical protein
VLSEAHFTMDAAVYISLEAMEAKKPLMNSAIRTNKIRKTLKLLSEFHFSANQEECFEAWNFFHLKFIFSRREQNVSK